MAMRYPGGLIATSPVNAAYPSGVWTQTQTTPYVTQNVWQNDQYWPYTTLLLHGDGTNGAQNNTFLDSSSNNFTITRNGNTTQGAFTPFQQNGYWSNYFDGSGDYLRYATNTSAPFSLGTSDFTDEAWVFPTAFAGGSSIISCQTQTSGTAANGYALYLNGSGQPGVLVAASSGTYAVNFLGTAIPLNAWTHLAVTRSGNTFTLWRNGVSDGTATSSVSISQDTTSGYGGWNVGGSPQTGQSHNGYISNTRLVKGTAVYTTAFTPPTAPLTAITNTSLLTCQSNRFVDNSSNAFTLTVNGNTAVQAFQPFPGPTTWSASIGGSGYFDGSGDTLTVAQNTANDFGTGDFSVEAWAYPTTAGYIVLQRPNSGFSAGNWYIYGGNGENNIAWNSRFASYDVQMRGVIPPNAWTHVCVTRSGNQGRFFCNGVLTGAATFGGSDSLGGFTTSVGDIASGAQNPFGGYITNVRLVKGSIPSAYQTSSTTIGATIFTPPTAPLTSVSGTGLLLNMTNAGIFDNAQMNNLETVGNAQVSTSVVKYGTGSMAFDGTGDYLLAPSNPNFAFGTGEFTVEMWLYPTASFGSGGVNIVGINSSGGGLFVGGTNKIAWNLFGTGDLVAFSSFTSSYNNVWTHVAYTRSGTTGRLFINGTQQASGTDSTNYTVTTNFAIGAANNGNQAYTGYIDDLRITKGVARYISNFTPPIARMPNQ